MPIYVLPDMVAAQIAAGEVVERPASVVKELLENALDAGATALAIDVHGSGRQLIRVRDNGQGIPTEEIELSLHRHATSKIRQIDDLAQLQTLGFRGEALYSISAVSRLTLTSRHRDEQVGARVVSEGGTILDARGIGVPAGTVVEVADLFFNVPARRKFLKSDATERRHITTLVMQYAMAYPDVRFQLTMDGREAFHTTGSGDLGEVVEAVMGIEIFHQMVEVTPMPPMRSDLPPIEVYGYTTIPDLDRANRSQIHLFINGRLISDQRLTYAVVQAYHTLLPAGRYPMAVIMLRLSPAEVDVNVHPTKAEVRFHAPDAVFTAVQRAVRRAVINQSGVPVVHKTSPGPSGSAPVSDEDVQKAQRLSALMSAGRTREAGQLDLDLDTFSPGRYSQQIAPDTNLEAQDEEDRFYPHYEAVTPPHLQQKANSVQSIDPTALPEGMGKPTRPRNLPLLRVIGQVGATYIVAEGPAGMYLIDQHAAHERILYEQFMAAFQSQQIAVQQVMETATIQLGAMQARLLDEYSEALAAIGFEVEEFGKNVYRIRSVPAILADRDPADVLLHLLQDAEAGKTPGAQAIEAKIIKRVCKAAAVKAGQILSHSEMQSLIHQLERCENPRTCPHGRPTLIHLSNTQLEKEFGRT